MKILHLDFEVYSELDVRRVGTFRYCEHPSTEVLMLAYAFDDDDVRMWLPWRDPEPPDTLLRAIAKRIKVGAHNAMFEYSTWNGPLTRHCGKHGYELPHMHITQMNCTAARAAMCSLPRALEKAGAAVNVPILKDKEAGKLINVFCKPRKPTKKDPRTRIMPLDDVPRFKQFIAYCKQDVRAERQLDKTLPQLPNFEKTVFYFDFRMNVRGLPIDIPMVRHAGLIIAELERRAHARVVEMTGVRPTQRDKLMAILNEKGLELENMQSGTLKALLDKDTITDEVRELLELRIEASKASTKKLISMNRVTGRDMRARGTALYYGAHTGRWAGRLIQPHNFIRGLLDKKEQIALMRAVFSLLENGDADTFEMLFKKPLTSIAMCMRGFIAAKRGRILRVVDYAQIEARVLVWLAGQDDVLQQFFAGLDVYKLLAAFLFSIPVDQVSSEQRRIAKNLVLGCGFGLGYENFIVYCAKNGVIIDEDMSKSAVRGYRDRNPRVVEYWYDVERCAIAAVKDKGQRVHLRNVSFYCDPAGEYLTIRLPSGRDLYYPQPAVRQVNRYAGKFNKDGTPRKAKWVDQLTFMQEIFFVWRRGSTYGGRLVENIVQAIARDVMAIGGLSAERAGYDVVGTVHDELITEVLLSFGSIHELEKLVCPKVDWLEGCPITAEGFETLRYRKN